MLGTRTWAALAVLTTWGSARTVHANAADLFGLGASASARSGAVSASVDDWSSAYYNPAGLAFGKGYRASFGVQATRSALQINGDDREVPEPVGVTIGASLPAPLTGRLANRVSLGIALYVLPTNILRVIARLPDQPFFPYYDNRSQRLMVLPSFAVRITDRLAAGVAVNFLAGVGGAVTTADGATRALEPRVDEEVYPSAKVNVGVRFEPTCNTSTALVYRQAFSVPFTTDTRNRVAGDRIDLDIDSEGLYTPHTIIVGGAWRSPSGAVTLGSDLYAALWGSYRGPFVRVTSRLPFVGPLEGRLPDAEFDTAFGARGGAEVAALSKDTMAIVIRGGAMFETSPVPPQPGVTNLVDGHKVGLSLGAGFRIGRVGRRAVTIDVHGALHLVTEVSSKKRVFGIGETGGLHEGLADELPDSAADPATLGIQISNPGYPEISGGGHILAGGLTLGFEL